MGAVHSSERNPVQFTVTPQTIRAIKECIRTNNYDRLRRELSGSTREQRLELFNIENPLEYIDLAVEQRNLGMVRYLVQDCGMSPNLTDLFGCTPLHLTVSEGWYAGTMVLLQNGADISIAEMAQKYLGSYFMPILHLAVLSGNEELVRELVRRGADINAKDSMGNDCFSLPVARPSLELRKFMGQEMCESQSGAGDSPYDLGNSDMSMFLVAVYVLEDISAAERLIENHSCDERKMWLSCEQRKMWQLLGAWFSTNGDHERALSCWRKETSSPCWLHDLNVVQEPAPESAFADILDVDVQYFLRTAHLSKDNERDRRIRSLLAIERHISQLPAMTTAVLLVVDSFLKEDKTVSAVSLLNRHIATRTLPLQEAHSIAQDLERVMDRLQAVSNLRCNVLLEFIATASRCLGFFTRTLSYSRNTLPNTQNFAPCQRNLLKKAVKSYLKAMNVFRELEVPASPEQLRSYHNYTKEFVSSFPCLEMKNLSPFWGSATTFLCSPSTIKTLVVCSAEVKGQVRQENCPPHLAANVDGDTPLHVFAQHLSQEDLLDNGVLECFLKHGADLCTRNRRGRSVRDILLERGILSAGALLPSLLCAAAAAFMRDPQLRRNLGQCGVAAIKHFLLEH